MLMLLSHDGKRLRPLCDVPSHPSIGSPAVSPAGDLIAFDGSKPGTGLEGTELLMVKADGTGLECLGGGAMPSWSADGKRLAFSSYAPRGVYVLDLATKKRELYDGPRNLDQEIRQYFQVTGKAGDYGSEAKVSQRGLQGEGRDRGGA
jgi:Tol biopolymer transport system component